MSEIARGGRTILFVSHNLAAVRNLCSHGIVLRNGSASPKQDVESAINAYSLDHQSTWASSWKRPKNRQGLRFILIQLPFVLKESSPRCDFECSVCIKSAPGALPVAISVDFMDDKFMPIMQAIPNYRPFIGGAAETSYVDVSIELPPLDSWTLSSKVLDWCAER